MKRLVWVIAFVMLTAVLCRAEVKRTCGVCFKRFVDGGAMQEWSDDYAVPVSFYTGTELNRAADGLFHEENSLYAVFNFDERKRTVKLDRVFMNLGETFDESEFNDTFGMASSAEGSDLSGRRWWIKTRQMGSMWY